MKRLILSILVAVAALAGCAIPTEDFIPPSSEPHVVDFGDVNVDTDVGNFTEHTVAVGAPDKAKGVRGGFTATFTGTGGTVCIIVDPQALPADIQSKDDGDTDLRAGQALNYNGVSGTLFGDFKGYFEDALGVPHDDDFNECEIGISDLFGNPNHMGRGHHEFCAIPTVAGVDYLIASETFSVPLDDGDLVIAFTVLDHDCDLNEDANVDAADIDEATLSQDRD